MKINRNSCKTAEYCPHWLYGCWENNHWAAGCQKLYRDFIDVDQEIEKKYNMTIQNVSAKGEAFFRQAEKDYIVDLCDHTQLKIVSLGGCIQTGRNQTRLLEALYRSFLGSIVGELEAAA